MDIRLPHLLSFGALAVVIAGCSSTPESGSGASQSQNEKPDSGKIAAVNFDTDVKPQLVKHCGQCHTGPEAKDGVDVTVLTAADKDKLMKLYKQIDSAKMPPPKAPQIPVEESKKLLADLKAVAG